MNILVTGGAGFIGSHVAEAYLAAGHEVTVVDNLSSGKREQVPAGAKFSQVSIEDADMESVFKSSPKVFDVVNHHAAQIDVRKSVADPKFDAHVNILGSLQLLECCRKYGVKKVIFASSGGTMYGECDQQPGREDKAPEPISPYGVSKLAVEHYLRFYEKIYSLDYTVLRYGNVYGPRQDPLGEAGVVAIFCGAILARKPVTIFGSGDQKRDYVYVKDVAQANVLALTRGSREILNVGTQQGASVNELFEMLQTISGYEQAPQRGAERPGELLTSVLETSKISRLFGWKPQTSFSEGVRLTYEYFEKIAL